MIDEEIIYKHLKKLNSIIEELKNLQKYTLDEISSERKKQWEVEHGLQLAIQNLLDIGSHILSAIGKNKCEDYTGVIDKLGEESIIPAEFSEKIRGMAGLRNILIHDYLEIEKEKIFNYLQNQLNDFIIFSKYIKLYLDKIK